MARSENINGHLVHLGHNVSLEADVQVRVVLVQVGLEFIIAQLVTWFVSAVVLGLLLNGIVSQVHKLVVQVVDAVLAA